MEGSEADIEKYLTKLFYTPASPGAFGGVDRLYRTVKQEGKYNISRGKILKFLRKQDAYTLHHPLVRKFRRRHVYVSL